MRTRFDVRPGRRLGVPASVRDCNFKCVCERGLVPSALVIQGSDGKQFFVSLLMDWMDQDSGRLRCPECPRVSGRFDWRGGPNAKLQWVKPLICVDQEFHLHGGSDSPIRFGRRYVAAPLVR
jgi:hypothetical protein